MAHRAYDALNEWSLDEEQNHVSWSQTGVFNHVLYMYLFVWHHRCEKYCHVSATKRAIKN
jgi:hypothetical protein